MSSTSKKRKASAELVYETPSVTPKNRNQERYLNAIRTNNIVFGVGPAGTGKTFLAAYEAAKALVNRDVDRIVICRPIVEASGENLGFLPGGINDKCDPYLRPIYDGLESVWSPKTITSYKGMGIIEVSPLAYMRGRTFTRTFVISDEMQNASEDQVLMLMTRLGPDSKMVITGDPDQRDRKCTGLEIAREKLSGCPMVSFVNFENKDVVRHKTVQDILERW